MTNLVTETEEKLLKIDFKGVYQIENIEDVYTVFSLKKKRSYTNILTEQVELINNIIRNVPREAFLHKIFSFKADVANAKRLKKKFDIVENFGKYVSPEVLDYLGGIVEEKYQINIEVRNPSDTNSNEQIQMNNDQAKILLKVSLAIKAYTFIILDSLSELTTVEFNVSKVDAVLFTCFKNEFFSYYQKDTNYKLENKLMKIVSSRVKSTKYSDKVIWNYFFNLSDDVATIQESFFIDIIANIITKLDIEKNVAVFIHSVLNNKIDHLFRSNNKLEYISHNSQITDEDSYHKIDQKLSRTDEANGILVDLSINYLMNYFDVSQKQVDAYAKLYKGKINKNQLNVVELFANKFRIKGHFNYMNFIKLRMCCFNFLVRNNLLRMAGAILSVTEESKSLSSFYKHNDLIHTKPYVRLIDRYCAVNDKIHDKKLLFNIVDMIVSTEKDFSLIQDKEAASIKVTNNAKELLLAEVLKFLEICTSDS